MQKGVRLRGSGWNLEVPGRTQKGLLRPGLAPSGAGFLREVSSSEGLRISGWGWGGGGPARKVHTCRRVCELARVGFQALKPPASELERPLEMAVPGDLRVGTQVVNDRNPTVGTKKESHRLLNLKDSSSGVT